MTKDELLKVIKFEIDYCETTSIKVNPAFSRTQMNIIDLIEKYHLSQYRDGDYDSFGNPRPFFNVTTYPVDISAKNIDMDVKDVRVIAEDENYWSSFFLQKELHYWMKEKYFGDFLNQLSYHTPKYGHTFVKKVEDRVHIVPLNSLRFRPDSYSTRNIPIIERHTYQADEFVLEAKKKGWENVDLVNLNPYQVVDNGIVYSNPKLQIFEAEFPVGFLDSKYNYFIVSGDGIVLGYDFHEQSIYKSLKWEHIRGRTLGRGVIEKLFHEQIYMNRLHTNKGEGLEYSSKHLFQTQDNSIAKNLLNQTDNGELITSNAPIEPIAIEERNLAFYADEEAKWQSLAYQKTFTQEPQQGKSRVANAKAQMAAQQLQAGYFKQKKEEHANFVKEIIWDWVLPEFKKDKKKEHELILRSILSGDNGSEKYFGMMLNDRLERRKFEMLMNGHLVMGDEEKVLKSVIAEEVKKEKIKIPKGEYDDLKFKIDIVIGDETIDLAERDQKLMLLANMANNNPGLISPSELKAIKNKLFESANINPHDIGTGDPILSIQDQMNQLKQGGQGGSLPKPNANPMPQQSPAAATV